MCQARPRLQAKKVGLYRGCDAEHSIIMEVLRIVLYLQSSRDPPGVFGTMSHGNQPPSVLDSDPYDTILLHASYLVPQQRMNCEQYHAINAQRF